MKIVAQWLVFMVLFNILLLNTGANASSEEVTVYSNKYQGKKTASGKRYNKRSMTAASPTLPFGSKVLLRNKQNGRSATVEIDDRKASGGSSKLDLSKAAANKLGITTRAKVNSRVISK